MSFERTIILIIANLRLCFSCTIIQALQDFKRGDVKLSKSICRSVVLFVVNSVLWKHK